MGRINDLLMTADGKPYITIQSMTTTKTADTTATIAQIKRLEAVGCDIVRVAVPDFESADAIAVIRDRISVPLVADIHFDYKLALRAVECGADKIRINPGNIGGDEGVKAVAGACRARDIPIRVGVNSGSLSKKILEKHGGVTAQAMAESAMEHVQLLHRYDFDNIWLSAKTSSVSLTVETYRLLHEMTNFHKGTKYPLHLGVTEAGTEYNGIIKSAMGIGALLIDGIGNTIRVSLTAEPEREVIAAKAMLRALGLRGGVDIISCPTCGRCNIDIRKIADEVEAALNGAEIARSGAENACSGAEARCGAEACSGEVPSKPHNSKIITIAIMGCAVNGPGEASHADYGIAGGDGEGIIFAKGKIIEKVSMDKLTERLLEIMKA